MLKKVLTIVVIFLGIISLIELGAYGFFYIKYGQLIPREKIQSTLVPLIETEEIFLQSNAGINDMDVNEHVLHPYLGFVRNFRKKRHLFDERIIQAPVNKFGFFGPSPVDAKKDGEVRVVIAGGSVAAQLYHYSKDRLIKTLEEGAKFKNKKIKIISLALSGMKQPQQLIALNWFLALGSEFDIFINLDGFNEVALPQTDNIPAGVYPFYPRKWNFYAAKSINEDTVKLLNRGIELKQEREKWRNLFSKSPFRNSNFILTVWYALKIKLKNKQVFIHNKIKDEKKLRAGSPQETGPDYSIESNEKLIQESVRFWKNSSLQMRDVLKANNIKYFHFLQPNQYFKDSKPLSDWEKKHAVSPNSKAAEPVQMGYPELIKTGRELNKAGIEFVDLTRVFQNKETTIYKDYCCHYNQFGNDILATEIGKKINDYFSKSS
jgi:hypothetical protein